MYLNRYRGLHDGNPLPSGWVETPSSPSPILGIIVILIGLFLVVVMITSPTKKRII